MKKLTDGLAQMIGVSIAIALFLTIMFPMVVYACWLWKTLVSLYPKL